MNVNHHCVMIMFCFGLPKINFRTYNYISYAVCFAGYSYIIRDILLVRDQIFDVGSRKLINGQTYLLQDTIVLFAVLFAISKLSQALKMSKFPTLMIFAFLIALGQVAILAQGLRLNLIITMGYLLFILITSQGKYNKIISYILFCTIVYFLISNISLFGFIIEKFLNAGANGKIKEFEEVILLVFGNWDIFLIGKGFGGEFFSPTYESNINFTHSLLSYLLLKAGLVGFVYGVSIYFLWIYYGVISILWKNEMLQILILSLAPPLLTQPTYKSFGFGIIIWMFVSMIKQLERRETNERIRSNINL